MKSLALLCCAAVSTTAAASPKLKGIACRSVHLAYAAGEGTAFYNEVVPRKSAPGTYFCVCAFHHGYFGIQELANGKKVVLFSVWDPGSQNNPNVVPQEKRVAVRHRGKGVRVRRFGNEGTGGQSFFDLDWQSGRTYRFLVKAGVDPQDKNRTAFAAYLFLPGEKKWRHLVTFSTLAKGVLLRGHYSFVEDFRRNRISTTKTRKAEFGPVWVADQKGKWSRVRKARFTADGNPVTNIDAGVSGTRFFLSTGGTIRNRNIPLGKSMTIEHNATRPTDLP